MASYLVDVEILLDPVSQEVERLCVLLGAEILGPHMDRLTIRTQVSRLLPEDGFGLGKPSLEEIVCDLRFKFSFLL